MSSVLTLVPTTIVCSVVESIIHSGLLRNQRVVIAMRIEI